MSTVRRYHESREPMRTLRHGRGNSSLLCAEAERICRVLNVARCNYDP